MSLEIGQKMRKGGEVWVVDSSAHKALVHEPANARQSGSFQSWWYFKNSQGARIVVTERDLSKWEVA